MSQYILHTTGPYKQNDGTAITASSTVVDNGSAKIVADGDNLSNVENSTQSRRGSVVVGGNDVAMPDVYGTLQVDIATVSSGDYTGFDQLTKASGSINFSTCNVGDAIVLDLNTIYGRVLYKVSDTVIICSTQLGEQFDMECKVYKGRIANQTLENFIMKKNDATVHGEANTTLASGAADYGRPKVKYMRSLRTRKVATKIRAGQYNMFTGLFTGGAVSNTNDYTSLDFDGTNIPDDETKTSSSNYGTKGEFAFNHGGRTISTNDYEAKTS